MILPTKHITPERALLTIGSRVLICLDQPKTVSALWLDTQRLLKKDFSKTLNNLSYNTFILTLDLLFLVSAIQYENGLIAKSSL